MFVCNMSKMYVCNMKSSNIQESTVAVNRKKRHRDLVKARKRSTRNSNEMNRQVGRTPYREMADVQKDNPIIPVICPFLGLLEI